MLVLTRRSDETIVIGGNIVIKVIGFVKNQRGNVAQVRLGIEAPKEITINRGEVHERIQMENEAVT